VRVNIPEEREKATLENRRHGVKKFTFMKFSFLKEHEDKR
jgi:hypothetical protein